MFQVAIKVFMRIVLRSVRGEVENLNFFMIGFEPGGDLFAVMPETAYSVILHSTNTSTKNVSSVNNTLLVSVSVKPNKLHITSIARSKKIMTVANLAHSLVALAAVHLQQYEKIRCYRSFARVS